MANDGQSRLPLLMGRPFLFEIVVGLRRHLHLGDLNVVPLRFEAYRLLDGFANVGQGNGPFVAAAQVDKRGDRQPLDGGVFLLPFLDRARIVIIGLLRFFELAAAAPAAAAL